MKRKKTRLLYLLLAAVCIICLMLDISRTEGKYAQEISVGAVHLSIRSEVSEEMKVNTDTEKIMEKPDSEEITIEEENAGLDIPDIPDL